MTPQNRRTALLATAVVLVAFHVFHAFVQGDGGWWNEHDNVGALWGFFDLSFNDPLLSAGLSDFTVVAVLFGIWMWADLPAEQRRTPKTAAWLLSYAVFPGLGALLYLLWLRPDHRIVTGSEPVRT